MKLEHRLSALLQLHLHSRLNTWLQRVGQRRLQDEMRIISNLGFGASYIKDSTVIHVNKRSPREEMNNVADVKLGISKIHDGQCKATSLILSAKIWFPIQCSRGHCSKKTRKKHDDIIKWKHFQRNWPFVRGIHRPPVNSPFKGQWRGALMFALICANKRLRKPSRRRWFEMTSHSLWRPINGNPTSRPPVRGILCPSWMQILTKS